MDSKSRALKLGMQLFNDVLKAINEDGATPHEVFTALAATIDSTCDISGLNKYEVHESIYNASQAMKRQGV